MKCHCGCPGAVLLFSTISCLNPKCRHFDKTAQKKSDINSYTVNGDDALEVMDFLGQETFFDYVFLWPEEESITD